MELYENTFKDIMGFNDFVNIRLIEDNIRIEPITVIPKDGELWIFYTEEQFEA